MDKKILVAAVAAAMMAPSIASADVKLYGIAQVEYNIEDSSANGVNSVQAVDDDGTRSRLGVKFSEKLGGGLTAFGKFEFQMDPSDGVANAAASNGNNAGLVQRDAHVGLKSSWGSLAGGSFHAPYKTAGGVKWDPWTATHLQARRSGGMFGGNGLGGTNSFINNAIYYTSPNVNGFKVQFAIMPDETNPGSNNGATATATVNSDEADNDYSVAVQYKNGPWHAIFAHNRNNVASNVNNGDDETLTKIGLRWKAGAWTLAGQYATASDAVASAGGAIGIAGPYRPRIGDDADVIWLNAQYKVGNNIFTASYGNMDVSGRGALNDYEYDSWTVGVIHKFSKKTRIFAGYIQTDGDNNAACTAGGGMQTCNSNDRDAWTIGMRKDF